MTTFFHTLYFKSAAGLALVLLIVGISYTIFASYMVHNINRASVQKINLDLALNLVRDNKIVHDGSIDKKVMKDTFMQYMKINPSIEIYYLDLTGKILNYSAEAGKVKRESVDLVPIQQRLADKSLLNLLGDNPRSEHEKNLFSVTPIPDIQNPEGYLYVMLQSEELGKVLDKQSQQSIIYLGGIVLSGSLIAGLLIGLYLFYKINRRLKLLQNKVEQFVESDFSLNSGGHFKAQRLILNDEISELENHVSLMVTHIQQQWHALKQQDSLRREMIANISHDLRTPLASIQGYLETLSVKYKTISDDEKQRYIVTAVRQATGLQKLIDSLFELAKLDAQEDKLQLEKFSLLELVYDVIAKFDIKAKHKNIKLTVETSLDNPMVYADLGLIERVLDNLIDNAIYYSHADSEINIIISNPETSAVSVMVSDSGCGIPADQKALVFERFHQAHAPERKDGHAGLGLCIVKKIIEMHHQQLWVESKVNKGTQFNFTLESV